MRKILSLVLIAVIAFGVAVLTTEPVEAGKGGKGKPGPDCSKICPPIGPCVAVACGFDCVYECPFPF